MLLLHLALWRDQNNVAGFLPYMDKGGWGTEWCDELSDMDTSQPIGFVTPQILPIRGLGGWTVCSCLLTVSFGQLFFLPVILTKEFLFQEIVLKNWQTRGNCDLRLILYWAVWSLFCSHSYSVVRFNQFALIQQNSCIWIPPLLLFIFALKRCRRNISTTYCREISWLKLYEW